MTIYRYAVIIILGDKYVFKSTATGKKGITKYKLSKISSVPYATINDICNGKTSILKCSAGTLYKIAKALDVTMEDLIEIDNEITKETLDTYLKSLATTYKKLNGDQGYAEIILMGDAAIIANYNFKHTLDSIDAKIRAVPDMSEAITTVGSEYHLSNNWINTTFKNSKSYSPNIAQYSKYYKTFANILKVRTMPGEYLIAMKLIYGISKDNDKFDIVNILKEHTDKGEPISFKQIDQAIINLYGGWDNITEESLTFIKSIIENDNREKR